MNKLKTNNKEIETEYIAILEAGIFRGEIKITKPFTEYVIPFCVSMNTPQILKWHFYIGKVLSDITDNETNKRTIKIEYNFNEMRL